MATVLDSSNGVKDEVFSASQLLFGYEMCATFSHAGGGDFETVSTFGNITHNSIIACGNSTNCKTPPGSHPRWNGGVLDPVSGMIYGCPYDATEVLRIDPNNTSATTLVVRHLPTLTNILVVRMILAPKRSTVFRDILQTITSSSSILRRKQLTPFLQA